MALGGLTGHNHAGKMVKVDAFSVVDKQRERARLPVIVMGRILGSGCVVHSESAPQPGEHLTTCK